jgi:hypothetical protein
LLGEFVDRVGASPASRWQRRMPYGDAKRHLSGPGSVDAEGDGPQQGHMFSKSEFFGACCPVTPSRRYWTTSPRAAALASRAS